MSILLQGKDEAIPHTTKGREDEDNEVPIISWDYMEQKTKEGKFDEADMTKKTLVGIDREAKRHISLVVPHKGENPHAIQATGDELNRSGYSKMILESDQEPSLLKLLEAANK